MRSTVILLVLVLITLQVINCQNFLQGEVVALREEPGEVVNFTQIIDEIENPNKKEYSFLVVDIRAPADYAPVHIQDAVNIPNANITADPTVVGNLTKIYERGNFPK